MQSAAPAEALPVLVVDDDSALIRTLADILRLHGYSPSTAETGNEGLDIARRSHPALAVVDLRLPDMDGMELASRLHELSEMTEVVVLTGNASVESAVAALREHSVDYLVKPVNVEHLLHVASLATERWQRRKAEERLKESDERFRRLVESDMLGIMFWDAEGKIDDANDAFLNITGYSRDDLDGGRLDWAKLIPPEYAKFDVRQETKRARNGVVAAYETEYVRRDGSRVPILIGASTIHGPSDGGVAFVLDITDRKTAQRALERRAKQQAVVASFGQKALLADDMTALFSEATKLVCETLELSHCGVFERKSDGASLVLRAALGWPADRVGQMTIAISEETQAGYTLLHGDPTIVDNMTEERRFPGATRLRELGIESGVTVVIPGPGGPYGVLSAHRKEQHHFTRDDVHFLQAIAHIVGTAVERNRTDRAFRQAQRLEAVGRLASGVAHDFNNMLTAITGYGEMLRGNLSADDPKRSDVEEILKAAGRAAGLTRQLLAFSRQQVLQPRLVMLNEIVTGIGKMLERILGADVHVQTSLEPDLGLIKADPGQIEQVILNLCVNARDAMPDGGTLTIETANVELDGAQTMEMSVDAPGSYVMLAVTDTGTGMDGETKARVFEPFFTTKSPEHGTGLGLATVYGIVKQSGGEIWVYSELGRGTTFKVFLPRLAETPAGELVPHEQPRHAPPKGSETILFAEDEDAIRRVGKRILERAGYTVLPASNGAEALKVAEEFKGHIALLVTDMMMPQMNGLQLAAQLRQKRPDTRTLFLSGYTDSTVVQQGPLHPDEHFLQKPFASETLVSKVREIIDTPEEGGDNHQNV
jgi:two-component system cell cycle sensor histidine kinase/response regulator CckA